MPANHQTMMPSVVSSVVPSVIPTVVPATQVMSVPAYPSVSANTVMVAPSVQYVSHAQYPAPTDQPYQQDITGLEFHAGGHGMAYAASNGSRRGPQQIYVPPSQRQM